MYGIKYSQAESEDFFGWSFPCKPVTQELWMAGLDWLAIARRWLCCKTWLVRYYISSLDLVWAKIK